MLAGERWEPVLRVYCPLKAGSIDGTDTRPHDRAIDRALKSIYKPNKAVQGDPECTLFVGRLDPTTTEETLNKIFSKYGDIVRIRLVRDIVTGMSKQYAFIEYTKPRYASRARRDANHMKVDSHEILVEDECERTLPKWIPRRLGGGFGGKKESGQLRFGGWERQFHKPIIIKKSESGSKGGQDDRQRHSHTDRQGERGGEGERRERPRSRERARSRERERRDMDRDKRVRERNKNRDPDQYDREHDDNRVRDLNQDQDPDQDEDQNPNRDQDRDHNSDNRNQYRYDRDPKRNRDRNRDQDQHHNRDHDPDDDRDRDHRRNRDREEKRYHDKGGNRDTSRYRHSEKDQEIRTETECETKYDGVTIKTEPGVANSNETMEVLNAHVSGSLQQFCLNIKQKKP